ncbi:methyl-accepting chemotaxis protein [bacterium]|nr:methyl-accepting chemotaxis protein [bacterium]
MKVKGLQSRIITVVIFCIFFFAASVLFYFEYEIYNQAIHSGKNINRLIGSKFHVAMANYITHSKKVFHSFNEIKKTIGFAISLNSFDEISEDVERFARELEFEEVIIITHTGRIISSEILTKRRKETLKIMSFEKSEMFIQWDEERKTYLYSEPLYVDDEYLGIVLAYLDFSKLKNLLREYSLLFLDYDLSDVVSYLKSKNFFVGKDINVYYLDLANGLKKEGFFIYRGRHYVSKIALPLPDGETGYIGCFVPEYELMRNVYKVGLISTFTTLILMLLAIVSLYFTVHKMLFPLSKLTELIAKSSENIGQISRDSSNVGSKLFSMVEHQSISIEQTYLDVEKLVNISGENALLAAKAKKVVHRANKMANHGENQMKIIMDSMNKLLEYAKDTSDVVNIIKQISSQIDIVAINASIEAARAGSKGREFAHVAKQVGELAQNSYLQSEKITYEIENTFKLLNESYQSIDQEKMTLINIVEQVDEASLLMNQIAVGSQNQTEAMKNLVVVLEQLDNTTKDNRIIADKTSKGGESLSEASLILAEVVKTLSVILGTEFNSNLLSEDKKIVNEDDIT